MKLQVTFEVFSEHTGVVPEQPSFQEQPLWAPHSAFVAQAVQSEAVPRQRLVDQLQPATVAQVLEALEMELEHAQTLNQQPCAQRNTRAT